MQAHLEGEVQLDGTIDILHEDWRNGGARYLYFRRDGDDRFSLHFAGPPPQGLADG